MIISFRASGIFCKIITTVFVSWFLIAPVFWHLDSSRPVSGYYDMFTMTPYGLLHLVAFYLIGFITLYSYRMNMRAGLLCLLLFSLYFPIIQLVNYPTLTMRDVYLHSAPVKTIVETGELKGPEGSSAASWPSSFYLHSILEILSGLDVVGANYVLYISLVFLLALILLSVASLLYRRGYRLGFLSALLFLCLFFNYLFDNFHHYSRTAFGFVLLFLFFFSYIRLSGRRGFVLQTILALSVILTHPFQSLALVAFVFVYALVQRMNRRVSSTLLILSFFVAWTLFQNPSVVVNEIRFLGTFNLHEYVEPALVTFSSQELLPWWSTVLSTYYRYSLIFLLTTAFLAMVFLVFRRRTANKIVTWLSSILLSSIVMLLALLLLPDWQLDRFTAFGAFAAAFSSLILIETIIRSHETVLSRISNLLPRRTLDIRRYGFAILLLFVVGLSASVMILRFEVNYSYGQMYHPSEMSALALLYGTAGDPSTINIVSWRTSIYWFYYDYNSTHDILRIWYLDLPELRNNMSRMLLSEGNLINQSEFVVRGLRDSYTLGPGSGELLRTIDNQILTQSFSEYYSNGYYFLYERAMSSKP